MEYQDAYKFIGTGQGRTLVDQHAYAELQEMFEKNYLSANNYEERLERHRSPVSVKHQTLNELNSYLLLIQARPEMRDNDEIKKISGSVPSRIKEIWEEDKRMTKFDAVKHYCELTGKDLYTIAVHMAEYSSLLEVFDRIHNEAYQIADGTGSVIKKVQALSPVGDQAYQEVISFMATLGKNLETSAGLNKKMSEEEYRDYFIPALNSISERHGAKGEVFNKKGKTDILVFDNIGNNIFLAECKLWNGAAQLRSAIDQLLGSYVNWRDDKTALVVFNRDVQKFSEVISSAREAVSNHELCAGETGSLSDVSYSYLFRHPDDPAKTCKLELLLFNCN